MNVAFVRIVLYGIFMLWTFALLILASTRLHYTLTLSSTDPLHGGQKFYDPSVAELMFCAVSGILFAPFMLLTIISQYEAGFMSRLWFEIASLTLLWFFWLGGAAAATDVWPATLLAGCAQFSQCSVLQAMLAFSWLGFLTLTILLFGTLFIAVRFSAWSEYAHGRWLYDGREPVAQMGISAPMDYNPGTGYVGSSPVGVATTINIAAPAAAADDYIVYDGYDERYQQYQPAQPQPSQRQPVQRQPIQRQGGPVRLTTIPGNYV